MLWVVVSVLEKQPGRKAVTVHCHLHQKGFRTFVSIWVLVVKPEYLRRFALLFEVYERLSFVKAVKLFLFDVVFHEPVLPTLRISRTECSISIDVVTSTVLCYEYTGIGSM